jgi:ferritin-like metal-binding protein YciE
LPGPDIASSAAAAGVSVANKLVAAAKGPVRALRGTSPADNELRNIRDCLWNEAEEIAHYHVIEAAAVALHDKVTAKLATTYRAEEEKMQRLLERQIAPLIRDVIKQEVPAKQRQATPAKRRPAKRAAAKSSNR